jgi:hypothetical protein
MMPMAEWKNSPFQQDPSGLLQLLLPLLSHASLEIQLGRGGGHETVGGGRRWLRGGLITHSPRPYTSSTAEEDPMGAELATAGLAAPPAVFSPLPSAQSASVGPVTTTGSAIAKNI